MRKPRLLPLVLLGLAALPGCTQCRGHETKAPQLKALHPPARVHSTFTSIGAYADGKSLSGGFVLNIPDDLDPDEPPGLLLSFHGDGRANNGWDDPGAMDRLARCRSRTAPTGGRARSPRTSATSTTSSSTT
jgi:hypothetical protein